VEKLKQQLNVYTLGKVLGTGMCGEVFQATHKQTGAQVAVKRLKEVHFEQAGLAFSDRELEIMRHLDHPNVVQLFDCIKKDGDIILVMELIKGGELFSYCIERGPLPESEARRLFVDIFSAVEYLHQQGVVHRDLKLENCLLLENGLNVKVIDFGLGNWFTEGDPLYTSCGSPNYAAPELFVARTYEGPPVDVWALGVIVYAMVGPAVILCLREV
jgi:serine/threonine protein kinase